MLRIAVIDDDTLLRDTVRASLEWYFADAGAWSLTAYADAESFWRDAFPDRYDIVFLDVMLPGESGIETARRLYAADKRIVIVFITAYPDFALQGYDVNAAGYLLKPFDGAQFAGAMRRCQERLSGEGMRRLAVKTGRRLKNVDISSITHMESVNRQVRVHTDEGPMDCTGRLDEYAERAAGDFLRVHKSFAVNRARITTMGAEIVVLDNGKTVPVSRSCRRRARDAFFSGLAGEETDGQ